MTEADQSLVLEILMQIQGDIASVKADVQELKQGQVRIREDVHSTGGHVISHHFPDEYKRQTTSERVDG